MSDRTRTFTWNDAQLVQDQVRRHTGLEFLQGVVAGVYSPPPMADLMGLRLTDVARGRVVFEVDPAEYHYNLNGVVHGGLAATILDSALGCCVTSCLAAGEHCATMELKVNFLKALTVEAGTVQAVATMTHLGRRTAVVEGRVTGRDDRVYAIASSTYLITRG